MLRVIVGGFTRIPAKCSVLKRIEIELLVILERWGTSDSFLDRGLQAGYSEKTYRTIQGTAKMDSDSS
jgi:hypothetical protein